MLLCVVLKHVAVYDLFNRGPLTRVFFEHLHEQFSEVFVNSIWHPLNFIVNNLFL